jgi:hypothetical protein
MGFSKGVYAGLAVAGLITSAVAMGVPKSMAATTADADNWGRTAAFCHLEAKPGPYREHIVDIGGSPKNGHITFTAIAEHWDGNSYVEEDSGPVDLHVDNVDHAVAVMNDDNAGHACQEIFTAQDHGSGFLNGAAFGEWDSVAKGTVQISASPPA